MATHEEHLETIESAWRPFREAVGRLDGSTLEKPTSSEWTGKEMLAHIAFWDETVEPVLGWVLEGENPPPWTFGSGYVPAEEEWPKDFVHNAREGEWAKGQSVAAVIERVDKAHEAALAAIRNLPEDKVSDPKYVGYLNDSAAHYTEHAAELDGLDGHS